MKYMTQTLDVLGELVELISGEDESGTIWSIPADEGNKDYQAYLAYLAEKESK